MSRQIEHVKEKHSHFRTNLSPAEAIVTDVRHVLREPKGIDRRDTILLQK